MAENQIKIRPALTGLEVGQTVKFPVRQMKSVRAQASELGVILDRKYTTATDRASRTITVTRIA